MSEADCRIIREFGWLWWEDQSQPKPEPNPDRPNFCRGQVRPQASLLRYASLCYTVLCCSIVCYSVLLLHYTVLCTDSFAQYKDLQACLLTLDPAPLCYSIVHYVLCYTKLYKV